MRAAILAALLPLALAACKSEHPAPPPKPRPVISEIVSPRTGLQTAYTGTIAARTTTNLSFPIGGTLALRKVEEGDIVTKGETLAKLDTQQLDAEERAAEAGVTVARAQLASAQDTADRVNALLAKGVDTPSQAETAKNSLVAAKARLVQAKSTLTQAQQLLGFVTLTAPQAGVITNAYVQPGAALNAGQPVVQLAGTHDREAVIDLSEQNAAGLSPGAVFTVRLEAAPDIETTAKLRLIDPVVDPATRTRRVHLTLAAGASDAFRLGALVQVEPSRKTKAQLTLPRTALIGGKPAVWVVDPASRKVRETSVSLGTSAGGRVVILSGLKTGQEVITKGVNSLRSGQKVGPGERAP